MPLVQWNQRAPGYIRELSIVDVPDLSEDYRWEASNQWIADVSSDDWKLLQERHPETAAEFEQITKKQAEAEADRLTEEEPNVLPPELDEKTGEGKSSAKG
jgi:hypothetical protein